MTQIIRISADLFKNNEGFTIIESLVSLIILGLLVVFTVTFFNKIYGNPVLLLRREALAFASEEIESVIANKSFTDTLYENTKGSLIIRRKVKDETSYFDVNVSVGFKQSSKEILSLKVYLKK